MSYCRYENTADNLEEVVDVWEEYDEDTANEYEKEGRKRIIIFAKEILEMEGLI